MKEYHVSIDEDFIAPEETLLDSGSEFSDLEQPISPNVFRFALWGVCALVGFVFLFTAHISVAKYQYYASLASQNRSANFSVPPPRGIIFDSDGKPLVQNVPSFDLIALSKEVKSALSDPVTMGKVAGILKLPAGELSARLAAELKSASVISVATELSKDQVLSLQFLKPQGFYVIPDAERSYIDGPVFSAILGYAGKVSKDDLANDPYYTPTDTVGRIGIEGAYEDALRGQHGEVYFDNVSGTTDVGAKTGNNVVLNIDGSLQRELYQQMHDILASAGRSRGAAVIQNPQTGAVLAMVSFPAYDNNIFSNGLTQAQYNTIFNNTSRPLFNRVIGGLYNPGSTIKPFMGMTALQEGVITPNTTIQDCISISIPNPYDKSVTYTYHNWRTDYGPFDLRRAIAQSCDVFFYTVGGGYGNIKGLGVQKIDSYLTKAMADKTLGIDLVGESHGFVPTPEWKEKTMGQPWYQGDSYNISIGQGDLQLTPLWLNTYVSAVANGGTIYKPEVANRVVDGDKNPVEVFSPAAIGKLPFSDQTIATVRDDMRETILTGTATLLKDLPVTAGAKTGTAQVVNGQQINSLFTIFAPYDHPTIAMTVLVEDPVGEGMAIRTANNVLKWYFSQTASVSSLN